MDNDNIILFPHTRINPSMLSEFLDAFDTLTICLPWFVEPPEAPSGGKNTLKICFPPETLKPQGDFRNLLSEYLNWMMENQGKKGPGSFSRNETGDETWSIRKAIRDAQKEASDFEGKNTLRWHLILHLARNLESERETAEALLKKAVATTSPLSEAMDVEETIPNIFEDLPVAETYPYITDRHQYLIFESWFGLFEKVIPKDCPFLTLDPQVFDYAQGLFDGKEALPNQTKASSTVQPEIPGFTVTLKTLPQLSDTASSTDSVLTGLSGRNLMLLAKC